MLTAPRGMAMLLSLEMQTLTRNGRVAATPCDRHAGIGVAASAGGGLGFGPLPQL
jgi:hypothetical protein